MSCDARLPNRRGGLFPGLVIGAACFLLSEALVPRVVNSPGHHDLLLANRLGFIYTPVVGIWLGWIQRSWGRAALGALIGLQVGCLYYLLCGPDFLAVMVLYPCLCGGAFAAFLGAAREDWLRGLGQRLGKGLLAGFVLGFVYMIALNVASAILFVTQGPMPAPPSVGAFTAPYVSMMWRAGPLALGAASGLFFPLMRWAVAPMGTPIPPGHCQACGYDLGGIVSGVCPECGSESRAAATP